MKKFRKYPFEENFYENPFNSYNNIEYDNGYGYVLDMQQNNEFMENEVNNNYKSRQLSDGALMNDNEEYNYNNNMMMNNMNNMNNNRNFNPNYNPNADRFRNIGNLIVSKEHNNNHFNNYNNMENHKNNYDNNNDLVNYQQGGFKNNRYGTYNSLKDSNNPNNFHEMGKNKYIFFNKDEYNKLYNSGKGITEQINKNLNLNESNNNNNDINNNNTNNNDIDEKFNYQLSTIKNENANSNNSEIVEEEKKNFIGQILEDSLNLINNSQNNEFFNNNKGNGKSNLNKNQEKRPFSPPITKIEDGEEQEI
jgi:hypothetical protein